MGGRRVQFEHGAQYLAPKPGTILHALLPELRDAGMARNPAARCKPVQRPERRPRPATQIEQWAEGRLGDVPAQRSGLLQWDAFAPWPPSKQCWVGTPSMAALSRHLAARAATQPGAGRLAVATGWRVKPGSLVPSPSGGPPGERWAALSAPTKGDGGGGVATRHAAVLVSGFASSVFNLVAPAAPSLAAPAGAIASDCCWALMVAFTSPLLGAGRGGGPPVDGALVTGSDSLAWVARDSSKPGRSSETECWVVHATAAWSNPRRDAQPAAVAQALLAEFLAAVGGYRGPAQAPLYLEAHRWGAAFPTNPAAAPGGFFADPELALGVAGDWCVGPRLGNAYESGSMLARWWLEQASSGGCAR